MTKYSKKLIKKMVEDGDNVRKYSALKLSSIEVAVEGFKLLRAATPSFGVGIDQLLDRDDLLNTPNTFAAMLQLLAENLTPEHFQELMDKNMGSLMFEGEEIEDWSEHFDEYPEDFLEVLIWLGEENFKSFFMKNITRLSWYEKLTKVFPKVKEKLKASWSDLDTAPNEE